MAHLDQLLTTLYGSGYGYVWVILGMALESCLIPLPSELVMPLAGYYLVYLGHYSTAGAALALVATALAGAFGSVIGSVVAYGIGRGGGRPLVLHYGRYILVSRRDADRADAWFARHGGKVAFFSRMMPVIRTYISLPAGIAEMSFGKFVIYTFLGSFPWCLMLAFVGYYAGPRLAAVLQQLGTVFHDLDIAIVALIILAVGLYIYRHIRMEYGADMSEQDTRPNLPTGIRR
jgi:membrane protein DedA with SNARE-associated domain